MPNHQLKCLADLGQFRPKRVPSLSEPTDHHRQHPGFVVFVAAHRVSGYIIKAGSSELSLTNDQREAWIFPTRIAIRHALDRGLGLNLRACRIEVVPAIRAPRTVKEAA